MRTSHILETCLVHQTFFILKIPPGHKLPTRHGPKPWKYSGEQDSFLSDWAHILKGIHAKKSLKGLNWDWSDPIYVLWRSLCCPTASESKGIRGYRGKIPSKARMWRCKGVNIKTSEDRAPDWTGYGGEDDDGIMDTAMFLVLVIRSIWSL